MRRRRRQRTVVVAVAAGVIALVGALAAGGQIGSLLAHSKEPHLELGAVLKGGDGRRIGTLELELHGAAVVFGRGVELRRWTPAHSELVSGAPFGVRWFLDLDDAAAARAGGSLVVETPSGRTVVLCTRCRARDSGRIKIDPAVAAPLVRNSAHAVYRTGSDRTAAGTVLLQRSRLQRAVVCTPARSGLVCSRFYTGHR